MNCDCWLCAGADPAAKADHERDIARHVRSHGWGVVALPADDGLPGWAYTVGLWHTLGAPELCLFGLSVPDMHRVLNKAGDHVRAGLDPRPGAVLDAAATGRPLVVRPVDPSWHGDLFAYGLDFYRGRRFPVRQLTWSPAPADRQPSLWLPKDDHPPTLWTRVTELTESPFPGVPVDCLVLGSASVIAGTASVAGVVHAADGTWTFHDAASAPPRPVHLRHIVAAHPYVRDFADLPPGYAARQEPDGNWSRTRLE